VGDRPLSKEEDGNPRITRLRPEGWFERLYSIPDPMWVPGSGRQSPLVQVEEGVKGEFPRIYNFDFGHAFPNVPPPNYWS